MFAREIRITTTPPPARSPKIIGLWITRGLSTAASTLLAARELAELFGVPESWVREQARLGNLPFFKLGHYVRFRIEEVERFFTQRASQAA
jgi:excisionase family DNA binding protein